MQSFGTGDKVKLPGSAPDRPNCYEFGATYEEIYNDLLSKDATLYPLRLSRNLRGIYKEDYKRLEQRF